MRILEGKEPVTALALLDDGMAVGGQSGSVLVWDPTSGQVGSFEHRTAAAERLDPCAQEAGRWHDHKSTITALVTIDGGDRLASSDEDGAIMIWSLATLEVLSAPPSHPTPLPPHTRMHLGGICEPFTSRFRSASVCSRAMWVPSLRLRGRAGSFGRVGRTALSAAGRSARAWWVRQRSHTSLCTSVRCM